MALVAYDNNDSSEYEEDENENDVQATITKRLKDEDTGSSKKTNNIEQAPNITSESLPESTSKLFNLLPQPSTKKPAVVEEDDEFLHKKEKVLDVKPRAKITVPSLSDFRDVESPTPAVKPKTGFGKKSGLLGMLPQPKNGLTTTITTKSFVPHVLTQTSSTKKKALSSPLKKQKTELSKSLINDYSDDSDNDEIENDFFSFNKPVEVPIADENLDQDSLRNEAVSQEPARSKLETYFKKDPVDNQVEIQSEFMESYEYGRSEAGSSNVNGREEVEADSASGDVLDEEAILKLCGARGKRKREEIQIVDVNQQEVLADAREWLLKGLMDDTSKRVSSSKRKGNEPTSQQKRKHQITYLAHQAKVNEAELQNQWANSRMSRRQTQNKYGF